MALSWPTSTSSLPRPRSALSPSTRTDTSADATPTRAARVSAVVLAPTTALVVMLLGLALLFVLPMVGLPFVAVVVLPAVVFHLRSDQRSRYRRGPS